MANKKDMGITSFVLTILSLCSFIYFLLSQKLRIEEHRGQRNYSDIENWVRDIFGVCPDPCPSLQYVAPPAPCYPLDWCFLFLSMIGFLLGLIFGLLSLKGKKKVFAIISLVIITALFLIIGLFILYQILYPFTQTSVVQPI